MEYSNPNIINGDASVDYRPENQLHVYEPTTKIISGQGKMEVTEFGAQRESNDGRGRFDLLPYEAIEALAQWFEAGAGKYGDRNWEKGISVKDCINRMIRHALKAGNGWTDEDHLAATMWNAGVAITMMKRRPDCNDHIWKTDTDIKIPKFDEDEIFSKIQYDNFAGVKLSPGEERLIRLAVRECNKGTSSLK